VQVRIKDIIVKERARGHEGDLESLMKSMEKHGQLNPIIINSKKQLIAGYRRLTAAKKLGWEKINATVLEITDKADMLAIEIDENVQRLEFESLDLEKAYNKLERLRKKNIFVRFWLWLKKTFLLIFKKNKNKN